MCCCCRDIFCMLGCVTQPHCPPWSYLASRGVSPSVRTCQTFLCHKLAHQPPHSRVQTTRTPSSYLPPHPPLPTPHAAAAPALHVWECQNCDGCGANEAKLGRRLCMPGTILTSLLTAKLVRQSYETAPDIVYSNTNFISDISLWL